MTLKIGLIGCGNISDIYLGNGPLFRDIAFSTCADLDLAAARRQAERYGLEPRSVEDLLASPDVDIVLNLTIPAAHAAVSLAALAAGKHVYSEKPLATTLDDGRRIVALARERGLRVGASPDTVLGASLQEARRLIDEGAIGQPLMGVATVLSHGMEHWHPNPAFFFQPGGGPVFDMGPYYLTALVTLLGPVSSVMATGQMVFAERTITAPDSPRLGQTIRVETLTTVQALLTFEAGAQVTLLASWDVWQHGMLPIELHGTKGSLRVPDPNWFGGEVHIAEERGERLAIDTRSRRLGRANWPHQEPIHANYRGLGLADMARGILDHRPHRANGDLALHVLAVMTSILRAAQAGEKIVIDPGCERPAAFSAADAESLLVAECNSPL